MNKIIAITLLICSFKNVDINATSSDNIFLKQTKLSAMWTTRKVQGFVTLPKTHAFYAFKNIETALNELVKASGNISISLLSLYFIYGINLFKYIHISNLISKLPENINLRILGIKNLNLKEKIEKSINVLSKINIPNGIKYLGNKPFIKTKMSSIRDYYCYSLKKIFKNPFKKQFDKKLDTEENFYI